MRTACGTTLVELLVALCLSLILLTLLSTLYLFTVRARQMQTDISLLQSHFNISARILRQELRLAGFIGCGRLKESFHQVTFQLNEAGVEEMTVRHRSLESAVLRTTMQRPDELVVSSGLHVSKGDILLISDCVNTDIFQVGEVYTYMGGEQRIRTLSPVSKLFQSGTEIGFMEVNSYSIIRGSLYRKDVHGRQNEVEQGLKKISFHPVYRNEKTLAAVSIVIELSQGAISRTGYEFVRL